MAQNKTLQMHLEDFRNQIIDVIWQQEVHVDIRADELINIGLERAIEAVKEIPIGN